MSTAIYIIAEKPELQSRIFVNGKALGEWYDHVGVIAVDKGLTHVEEYIVPEVNMDTFLALGATEAEVKAARERFSKIWFDPKKGLEYFTEILRFVRNDDCTTDDMKTAIIQDIEEYIVAFNVLVAENSRWRLQWDY